VILARLRGFLGRSRFIRGSSGQDLVEYALLVALIGLVAAAAAPTIETAISTAYTSWNTDNQILWQPQDPGAGS
jgi:Flp pilus assembly pilin Flp